MCAFFFLFRIFSCILTLFLRDADNKRGVNYFSLCSDSLSELLLLPSELSGVVLLDELSSLCGCGWRLVEGLGCPAWAVAWFRFLEYSCCNILDETGLFERGDPLVSSVNSVLSGWWMVQWKIPVFESKYCGWTGTIFTLDGLFLFTGTGEGSKSLSKVVATRSTAFCHSPYMRACTMFLKRMLLSGDNKVLSWAKKRDRYALKTGKVLQCKRTVFVDKYAISKYLRG